jgi:CRISPR/Cas system-associated endonuclease Cas3-HD
LENEGITTLDQLKAVAERLVGIGPKMARIIREELVRASTPGE